MEFPYDAGSKESCWYKKICDQTKCGEDALCQRHYRMSYLVDAATMEGNQRFTVPLSPEPIDSDSYKRLRDIKDGIHDFVTEGRGLLIYSKNTGNGKTEWAKKLLLAWFNSIWSRTDFVCRGLFVQMPRFMFAMKDNIREPNEYFQYVNENIATCDLVVWDEINYKEWSPFELDYMLNIINQRVSVGKANIFTTNYDLKTVSDKLGTRLASRIVGNSECIEFKGKDRRGCASVGK